MSRARRPSVEGTRVGQLLVSVRALRGAGLLGAFSQAATFVALFLPVVFGLSDSLVTLVQATALAAIALHPAVLVCEARLPTVAEGERARRMLWSSFSALLVVVAAFELAGLVFLLNHLAAAEVLLAAGAVLLGQGLYTMRLAHLTRVLDLRQIMATRLLYGVAVLVTTLILCLVKASGPWFAVGNGLAFVLAVCTFSRADLRLSHMPSPMRHFGAEVRDALPLMGAYLLGGFSGQAGALSVGLVGPIAPAWAVACRIMGGFQTIGGQLVGPAVDVEVARSVQTREAPALRRAVNRGLVAGVVLVVLMVLGSVAALLWVGDADQLDSAESVALIVGVVGFAGANVVLSPIGRTLGMIGRARARVIWDIGRFLVLGAAVVALRDEHLLVALTVASLAATAVYIALVIRARRQVVRGPATDHAGVKEVINVTD